MNNLVNSSKFCIRRKVHPRCDPIEFWKSSHSFIRPQRHRTAQYETGYNLYISWSRLAVGRLSVARVYQGHNMDRGGPLHLPLPTLSRPANCLNSGETFTPSPPRPLPSEYSDSIQGLPLVIKCQDYWGVGGGGGAGSLVSHQCLLDSSLAPGTAGVVAVGVDCPNIILTPPTMHGYPESTESEGSGP